MAWQSLSRNNQEMVDKFVRLGIIESKAVENAFRCVSRAAFVPEHQIDEAFRDTPLRGSPHIHMSAPHMYASILEDLELEEGMSFLNIGSGTGYFSTLIGYIIKKDAINHGVELYESTVRFAREHVDDFLQHSLPDTKDICPPIFIAGNCFRLDTEQMKYDRVYCGAACPQSKVKFLLKLVKVGGFLIAPVGTRLIKLERLSEKEGKQSVINDVCFAPLIMPTPDDLRLPKLTFPAVDKKQKEKDSTFPVVNFPVSRSQARKTLARMRALQDALECVENGCQLPSPFSYVPSMEQMNKLKRNAKRMKDIRLAKLQPKTKPTSSAVDSSIDRVSSGTSSSRRGQHRSRESRSTSQETELVHLKGSKTKQEKGIPKDIWEHICFDKQWLQVLEYYYSVCATTDNRRQQCFNIKSFELGSLEERLHEILPFKSHAKKIGLLCRSETEAKTASVPGVEGVADTVVNNLLENVLERIECNESEKETNTSTISEVPQSTMIAVQVRSPSSTDMTNTQPVLTTFTPQQANTSPSLTTFTPPQTNAIPQGCSVSRALVLDNLPQMESEVDDISSSTVDGITMLTTQNLQVSSANESLSDPKIDYREARIISYEENTGNSDDTNGLTAAVTSDNSLTNAETVQLPNNGFEKTTTAVEGHALDADEHPVRPVAELSDTDTSVPPPYDANVLVSLPVLLLDCDSPRDADQTVLDSMKKKAEIVCESEDKSSPNKGLSSNVPKRSKKKKLKKLTDIEVDKQASDSLQSLPGSNWSLEHDIELVSFLSKLEQSTEQRLFRSSCPRIIRPDLFAKPDLMLYPKICPFPATMLANRSIILKRLADILDSAMELLVGKSLDRDQFRSPYEKSYPLPSFTDKSFESSGIPLSSNNDELPSDKDKSSERNESLKNLKKSPESDLLLEVDSMIGMELDNVKQQEEILCKKLKLLENLDKQYKEQTRLLKQQIDLIEEQQNLIQSCQIQVEFLDDSSREKFHHTQQVVFERKQHRQQLIERRKQIEGQQVEQDDEKKELMQMVQQLMTLENRLVQEKEYLWKKGINYLQDENDDLSQFSKFVAKSGEILERIRKSEFRVSSEKSYEESMTEIPSREKENGDLRQLSNKYRYQPDTILPRCRFLLPLTTKRHGTIKDLLRNSEVSQPPHCPVVLLDRQTPLEERHTFPASRTIFMQLYQSLKSKKLNYRWKKCYAQWWEVKFTGEGIIDQGGGFRDSLAEIADELCPPSADMKECLSLFVKTPNQRDQIGEYRDCYIPNPSCKKQSHLYCWLGQLMGAAFRTDETIPLALPPFIWKLLVGEHVTWKQDYIGVDTAAVKLVDGVELLDPEAYDGLYGFEQYYTTILSDAKEVELKRYGREEVVQPNERKEYSLLVRKARMLESAEQVKFIREGLLSVIPEAVLSCLTWKDLERGVCGEPEITVEDLKANCRYGDDLTPESDCVSHFWTAITKFSNEEKSRFIRFITGRKRLPSPFIVSRSSGDEQSLPNASTCGSNLFLPSYANADIATEKLRYAIYHCVAIDTDTSPW